MPKRCKSPKACIQCGRVWTPYEDATRYCSKSCEWTALKGPEFNARIARESMAARGDALRGRGNGLAYRKRNGRHEHRGVAEQKLGRPLATGEIVHHMDGNKLNNDPENLAVMTRAQHMLEHGIGVPGMKLWWKPWEKRKATR